MKVDGFLFYHKEASYTPGESPLVLWLFPFMFEELFEGYRINPSYHSERPEGYSNYLTYIEEFNKTVLAKKNRKKTKTSDSSMESESQMLDDSSETFQDEHEVMMQLEMTGNDV